MKSLKVKNIAHDDLASLLEHGPTATLGATTSGRRKLAGKPVTRTSNRKAPEEKRDKQFNVNISGELQDLIQQLTRQHGISKAELIHRAVKAFKKHPEDFQ